MLLVGEMREEIYPQLKRLERRELEHHNSWGDSWFCQGRRVGSGKRYHAGFMRAQVTWGGGGEMREEVLNSSGSSDKSSSTTTPGGTLGPRELEHHTGNGKQPGELEV